MKFIHEYLDVIIVELASFGAFAISYIDPLSIYIRFGVLLIGGGYGAWRWYTEYQKHKKDNSGK